MVRHECAFFRKLRFKCQLLSITHKWAELIDRKVVPDIKITDSSKPLKLSSNKIGLLSYQIHVANLII